MLDVIDTKDYDPKLARQSVQAQAVASPIDGLPFGIGIGDNLLWVNLGRFAEEVPLWSIYPGPRDAYLRNIAKYEPMMASALYSMKTRMVTLGYELQGPKMAKKFAQEVLRTADFGKSIESLLAKGTDDLLSTDNGLFIERYGPGRPDKPLRQVLAIAHLDSRRCYRTFDPEWPIIYDNPETGALHRMHYTRVVMTADNPQPIERARGVGFCAVSRALQWVRIIRDSLTYREEKVAGRFTRAIGISKGITKGQLKDALLSSQEDAEAKGFVVYKGIPIIATPGYEPGKDLDLVIRDLASIPDGFVFESDLTLYAYVLAFAFGVDAREFWPATASGATKADATVQNQKAQGRGIGSLIRTWENVLRACLPETVEFTFDFTDDEQDLMKHQVQGARLGNLSRLQIGGAISAQEYRALAIADGILDPKILDTVAAPPVEESTPANGMPGNQPTPDKAPTTEDTPEGEGEKTQLQLPFGQKDLRGPANAYYESAANEFQLELEAAVEDAIQRLPDEPTPEQVERITDDLLGDLLALLETGLTIAFGIGLAGAEPTITGLTNLQRTAYSQRSYIAGLADDFRNAALGGIGIGLAGVALRDSLRSFIPRVALYAGSFWETIWQGLRDVVMSQPRQLKVRRVLDDRAAHCTTCPPKAGEYDNFDAMVAIAGIPGDGSDECRTNCRCHIEIETSPGSGNFERYNGQPTVFVEPLIRLR